MKSLCLAVSLILVASWAFGEESPSNTVTLVTVKYPPYSDPDLPGGGIVTQIARASFAVKGYEMKLTYLPWVRVLSDTKVGRFDGVLGIWYRKDRATWLAYSEPLAVNKMVLVKRKDWDYVYKDLRSLQGYRVGNVRGYASPPVFAENGIAFEEVYDDITNLKKLMVGRIQFALIDHATVFYIYKSEYPEMEVSIETIGPEFDVEPSYAAFNNSNPQHKKWIRILNEGLTVIKKNGIYQDIQKQYGVHDKKIK